MQQLVIGQSQFAIPFARIYQEYQTNRRSPSVERLVMLDQELRRLLPPGGPFASADDLRAGYEEIGLEPTLFEPDTVIYSGKLLAEAHKRDPSSPFRRYTLYATVSPEFNGLPSPSAGRQYLKEFPEGPFAADTNGALADFLNDLFKVIKRLVEGAPDAKDYKYDCYSEFLSKAPLAEQMSGVQRSGLYYYRRVLALQPDSPNVREAMRNLERGVNGGWYYCPD
ncbi:MAG: hypothetical protein ABL993_08125 [Vicinamibacterales bacterium]